MGLHMRAQVCCGLELIPVPHKSLLFHMVQCGNIFQILHNIHSFFGLDVECANHNASFDTLSRVYITFHLCQYFQYFRPQKINNWSAKFALI